MENYRVNNPFGEERYNFEYRRIPWEAMDWAINKFPDVVMRLVERCPECEGGLHSKSLSGDGTLGYLMP